MLILYDISVKEDAPKKAIPNKGSRRNKIIFNKTKYLETVLSWHILRITAETNEGFYVIMPSEKLTDVLTNDFVIDFLNNQSDLTQKFSLKQHDLFYLKFDYLAPEIHKRYRPALSAHLLFEYVDGKWQKGYNDGYNQTEIIAEGTAEFSNILL